MDQLTVLERELLKASGALRETLGVEVKALQAKLTAFSSEIEKQTNLGRQNLTQIESGLNEKLLTGLRAYEQRTLSMEKAFRDLVSSSSILDRKLTDLANEAAQRASSLNAFNERLTLLETSQRSLIAGLNALKPK